MNYGELKAELLAIAKLTAADTVGARVAKFVKRAEDMIAARVRAVEMMSGYGLTEADRSGPGSAVYNLHVTTLDVITMSMDGGGGRVQRRRGVFELTHYFALDGPVHSFAVRSDGTRLTVQFRGVPAENAAGFVQTWERPATMSNDSDTRTLLTNFEGLYINAALHWLYIDAHDLELAGGHKQLFLDEVKSVNVAAQTALRAGQIAALESNFEAGGSAM